MHLYPYGLTKLFNLFSCTLYIGDHNGDVPIVVVSVVVVCRAAAIVVVLAGLVVSVELVL